MGREENTFWDGGGAILTRNSFESAAFGWGFEEGVDRRAEAVVRVKRIFNFRLFHIIITCFYHLYL